MACVSAISAQISLKTRLVLMVPSLVVRLIICTFVTDGYDEWSLLLNDMFGSLSPLFL